jgi:hypothetical protein
LFSNYLHPPEFSDIARADGRQQVATLSIGRRTDNTVVMINSILLAFINAGSIVGSLIGSLVVGSSASMPTTTSTTADNSSTESSLNVVTDNYDDVDVSSATSSGVSCRSPGNPPVCGVDHCPFVAEHVTGFAPSDQRLIYFAAGVSLAFNVGAIFISVVVLKPPPGLSASSSSAGGCCGVGRQRPGAAADDENGPCMSSTGSVVVVVGSGRLSEVHTFSGGCMRPLGATAAAAAASDEKTKDANGLAKNRVEIPAATSVRKRIIGTFRLLADHRLLLLIPSVMLMGVVCSFSVGAFNQVSILLFRRKKEMVARFDD